MEKAQVKIALIGAAASIAVAFVTALSQARPAVAQALDERTGDVAKLRATVESLEASLKELKDLNLRDAVVGFAASECPRGWTPYLPGAGRFLRGIDTTGQNDPDGRRAPSSTQDDELKSHSHDASQFVNDGKVVTGHVEGGHDTSYTIWGDKQATAKTGGRETRPKNAAVLFCLKV